MIRHRRTALRTGIRALGALTSLVTVAASAQPELVPEPFLVPLGAEWHYHADASNPGSAWKNAEFDDTDWRIGTAGFGYGDDDDDTFLGDMRGNYARIYLRREFDLPALPERLFLHARYDDGFVAYINGTLVARVGMERGRALDHEADALEVFELSTKPLQVGRNVLAVMGMNVRSTSSDFSLNLGISSSLLPSGVILGESARRDLAFLRKRLLTQGAYLHRGDNDVIAVLDAVSSGLPHAMMKVDFLRAVQQIMALLGDGHADAGADYENDNAAYLPFSLADTGRDIVAVRVDDPQRALVEPRFPFLIELDGVPVGRWIEQASRYQGYIGRRWLRSVPTGSSSTVWASRSTMSCNRQPRTSSASPTPCSRRRVES